MRLTVAMLRSLGMVIAHTVANSSPDCEPFRSPGEFAEDHVPKARYDAMLAAQEWVREQIERRASRSLESKRRLAEAKRMAAYRNLQAIACKAGVKSPGTMDKDVAEARLALDVAEAKLRDIEARGRPSAPTATRPGGAETRHTTGPQPTFNQDSTHAEH
jgi:hypothetical protein